MPYIPKDQMDNMVTREEAQRLAAEAAREAVAQAMAAMAVPAQGGGGGDAMAFANALAMQIAALANQGTGKEVVDPVLLEKRSKARERMFALINQAQAEGKQPEYILVHQTHLADQYIQPLYTDANRQTQQTHIYWSGVPNRAMQPAPNDQAALDIFIAFLEWIGEEHLLGSVQASATRNNVAKFGTVGKSMFLAGPQLRIDDAALPARETPQNGLQVLGQTGRGGAGREIDVPILGTVAPPAKQLVA